MKLQHQTGTFIILRIQEESSIRDKQGLKIFGVRFAKFLPEGWVRRTECTPSFELLNLCKKIEKENKYEPQLYPKVKITKEVDLYLKSNPVWNEYVFKELYIPNFIENIQHEKAKNELREIMQELKKGNDVYYACFCANDKTCHRRIMAAIIQKQGYPIARIQKEK